MKRFAAWLMGLCFFPLLAIAITEGTEYQRIIPPVPTQSQVVGRVEVVEMFWYGCPHCFHFEPIITEWAKNRAPNVDFVRVPAIFRDDWEPLARAFYTAEVLGVLDRIHDPLFHAVQLQHRKLDNDDALRAFFVEQGVPVEDFNRVFRSFVVEVRLNRAKALTSGSGIDGVPAVIVSGTYRTNGTLAGGLEKVPMVINVMVQQVLAGPLP